MQVSDRTVARVAMLATALLHGVILAMLVRPPVATHSSADADAGQGDALQVVFIVRRPQPPAAPRREADDAARATGVAIGSDVVTSPPRVERGVDAGRDAQAGATHAAATGIVDRPVLDIALRELRNRPPGATAPARLARAPNRAGAGHHAVRAGLGPGGRCDRAGAVPLAGGGRGARTLRQAAAAMRRGRAQAPRTRLPHARS